MKKETANTSGTGDKALRTEELEAGKDAVAQAYKQLMEAKAHFSKAAESAGIEFKDDALEKLHKGEKSIEALGSQVAISAKNNPLATLGVAVAVGFLLSKVITRR